jgi:hypothetical protein
MSILMAPAKYVPRDIAIKIWGPRKNAPGDFGGPVQKVPGSCFGEHGVGHLMLCYATDQYSIESAITRIKQWAEQF